VGSEGRLCWGVWAVKERGVTPCSEGSAVQCRCWLAAFCSSGRCDGWGEGEGRGEMVMSGGTKRVNSCSAPLHPPPLPCTLSHVVTPAALSAHPPPPRNWWHHRCAPTCFCRMPALLEAMTTNGSTSLWPRPPVAAACCALLSLAVCVPPPRNVPVHVIMSVSALCVSVCVNSG